MTSRRDVTGMLRIQGHPQMAAKGPQFSYFQVSELQQIQPDVISMYETHICMLYTHDTTYTDNVHMQRTLYGHVNSSLCQHVKYTCQPHVSLCQSDCQYVCLSTLLYMSARAILDFFLNFMLVTIRDFVCQPKCQIVSMSGSQELSPGSSVVWVASMGQNKLQKCFAMHSRQGLKSVSAIGFCIK